MYEANLLDEKVTFHLGSLPQIRRWWRGVHPGKGTITLGWSGWETVEEKEHVPIRVFTVHE